jgi:hypothetical protein
MSQPNNQVFIGFTLEVGGGNFFTLNDSVKGELDNPTFKLASEDVLVDVSEDVRSIQVRRGRSRELDKFNAGSVNILLSNANRKYDPTNARETSTRQNRSTNPSFESNTTGVITEVSEIRPELFIIGDPVRGVIGSIFEIANPNNIFVFAGGTPYTTAGASAARITTDFFWGNASLEVTTTNLSSNQGFFMEFPGLLADSTYIFSAYVRPVSGSSVYLRAYDDTNNINGTQSADASVGGGWQRISSVITTGASVATVQLVFVNNFVTPDPYFELNDPVKGLLDDATFRLAPSESTQSVFRVDGILGEVGSVLNPWFDGGLADSSILLPVTTWAGTPNNSISNLTFSIPGTGSPFFPDIVPRKQVKFTSNGIDVFKGVIDDWNFSYEIKGDATAQVIGADGFTLLAQANIEPQSFLEQSSGARVSTVLSLPEVNWPNADRSIQAGSSTVQAQTLTNTTNALSYLQQVEEAESGALFISREGLLTFLDRSELAGTTTRVFADDGTGIPFVDVNIDYGTEELRNRVSITRQGTSTVLTAENLASITSFGAADYEISNSLLSTDEQAENLAVFLVSKYGEPRLRIDRVSVVLNDITPAQVAECLNLELGDTVKVVFTPENIGDPIEQFVIIDSITHDVSPVDHVITYDLSQANVGFILDDPEFGVLDTSRLAL